jgi:hypothetical protein
MKSLILMAVIQKETNTLFIFNMAAKGLTARSVN